MHYLEYSGFTSVTTKGGFIQAASLVLCRSNQMLLKLHTTVNFLTILFDKSNPKSPNCELKSLSIFPTMWYPRSPTRAVCRSFAKKWQTWDILKRGGGRSCKQRQGKHWKTKLKISLVIESPRRPKWTPYHNTPSLIRLECQSQGFIE